MRAGEHNSRLSTTGVARLTGVHPNTVRLYEKWGFLAPVPRGPNGYRQYSAEHLDQMRLARLVMGGPWAGRAIRRLGVEVIRLVVSGDLEAALDQAYAHLRLVLAESTRASDTARVVEGWALSTTPLPVTFPPLQIKEAAQSMGASVDMLRNWERNGLVWVPRNPHNGYRLYGAPEINRLQVIRMLLSAGYSIMAVLRMLLVLDQGLGTDVAHTLDTPRPDEDVVTAADRWLSSLAEAEQRAEKIIRLLQEMLAKR